MARASDSLAEDAAALSLGQPLGEAGWRAAASVVPEDAPDLEVVAAARERQHEQDPRLLRRQVLGIDGRDPPAFPLAWVRDRKFWPTVGRVDNAHGDRVLICTCPSVEEYA